MSSTKKTVSFLDVLTGKKENLVNEKKNEVLALSQEENNNNTKNHHHCHFGEEKRSGFCPLTKNAQVAPDGVASSLRRNDNIRDEKQTSSSSRSSSCDANIQQERSTFTSLLTVSSSSASKNISLSPLRPPPPLSATFTSNAVTRAVGMLHVFPEFISKNTNNENEDDVKENRTANAKMNSTIKYHVIVGVDLCGNTHFLSSDNNINDAKEPLWVLQNQVIRASIEQTRSCLNYSSLSPEEGTQEKESACSVLSFSSKKLFVSTFCMPQQHATNENNNDHHHHPSASPPSPFTFLQQLNYQFSITHVPMSVAKSMCTFVSFKLIPIFSSASSTTTSNSIDDDHDELNEGTFSPEFAQTFRRFGNNSQEISALVEKDDEEKNCHQQLKSLLQRELILKYQLSANKFRRLQKIQHDNNNNLPGENNEQCCLCGKIAGPATTIMCSDQHQKLSLGEVKSVLYGPSGQIFISIRNLDDRWSHSRNGNTNKHSSSSSSTIVAPLFLATATSTMCVGGNDFWRKFAPTPQQPLPESRPPRLVYFIPHRAEHDGEHFAMIRSIDVPQGVYVRFFSQEAKQKMAVTQNNNHHNNNNASKYYRKK